MTRRAKTRRAISIALAAVMALATAACAVAGEGNAPSAAGSGSHPPSAGPAKSKARTATTAKVKAKPPSAYEPGLYAICIRHSPPAHRAQCRADAWKAARAEAQLAREMPEGPPPHLLLGIVRIAQVPPQWSPLFSSSGYWIGKINRQYVTVYAGINKDARAGGTYTNPAVLVGTRPTPLALPVLHDIPAPSGHDPLTIAAVHGDVVELRAPDAHWLFDVRTRTYRSPNS
jgi:hypothetical protein